VALHEFREVHLSVLYKQANQAGDILVSNLSEELFQQDGSSHQWHASQSHATREHFVIREDMTEVSLAHQRHS
jgi:hypothetical protein